MNPTDSGGRIITFYSYKGGTGRSMALANVAWILASNGLRVLVIDWDLEAPGLHRYFHPFLEDKELANSPGLIDYVTEFSEAARHAVGGTESEAKDKWYDRYTCLLRWTYSLEWDFGDGTLDFVPAGQQGPGYALRVHGFDWQEFYEKLGGGVLLEALKNRLREDYDYVLIDSRTGISDTSGICTVQMPDDLVVCFTLNQQSIKGAAAVAESADLLRRRDTGEPSLRIWPVPTRVELFERDRLEAAREVAHSTFQHYLGHLRRNQRQDYWDGIEILYQPYFAYEEVLAVFAEKRQQKASMLSSLEHLTRELSRGAVKELARLREPERLRGLKLFQRFVPTEGARAARGQIFISWPSDDVAAIEPVVKRLREGFGNAIWWDRDELAPGDNWGRVIDEAVKKAKVVIAFFGPHWAKRATPRMFEAQVAEMLERDIVVIPVLVGDLRVSEWAAAAEAAGLEHVTRFHAVRLTGDSASEMEPLSRAIEMNLADRAETAAATADPDDPQKGQWGRRSSVDGRVLAAEVSEISDGWFDVVLEVRRTGGPPLAGDVEFHLHPTFKPAVHKVPVDGAGATLRLSAWGAFTVGAVTDGGRTMLELDLAEVASFPELFKSR